MNEVPGSPQLVGESDESRRLPLCVVEQQDLRHCAILPRSEIPKRDGEEAAHTASSAPAMVDTVERLLDRDLEASDDAGVAASRE